MNKIFLLPFLFFFLIGCSVGTDKLSISEISPERADSKVKDFINQLEIIKDEDSNGIFTFNESEKRFYLFLSQEFLDSGKDFGKVDIKIEGNTLNIYLNQSSDNDQENKISQKLYEINNSNDTEVLRVFKDGEETHIQIVGL